MPQEKDSSFTKYPERHEERFTVIPNKLILDRRLTDAAKCVLIYLLHNSPDWVVYQKKMMDDLGHGRDKSKEAIALLEQLGYLKREQIRVRGKFAHYKYQYHHSPIFECSQLPVHTVDKSIKNGKKKSPSPDNPAPENPHLPKTNVTSPSEKDIVPTVNPINGKEGTKNKTLLDRYKLNDSEREAFRLLKIAGVNSDDKTLCYFAKSYPFAMIASAIEEMKTYRPGNPGGYIRKLLKMTKECKDYNKALNSAFAYDFKESAGWDSLIINKTHAEDLNVKISLSMNGELFAKALIEAFEC